LGRVLLRARGGRRSFPDLGLELALDASGNVVWSRSDGKTPRLTPELRKLAKEIATALGVQRAKLEERLGGAWTRDEWRSFERSPILAHLARRLVWSVHDDDRERLAFLQGSDLVSLEGEVVAPGPGALLTLVHPVTLDASRLERARDVLCERGIVQPWKQLFRETYAPLPRERTARATERFAGQVVPHAQLYALARTRGWSGLGCIGWGSYEGTRQLRGVRARLVTAGDGPQDLEDRARPIRLGPLSFEERHGRGWIALPLGEVPLEVFSEICRDVDLFAAVGAASDDKRTLPDARTALLLRVIPALGLGERVRVEGSFARVEGELRAYRVHLATASVFAEPGSRFIAFAAPARDTAPSVYLPEDGAADPRTAEVVARILTLAADRLIADPELLAQLAEL
jgi:hypothetical protein